jgi:RNA polymerase sigma-70 factor (ECF subfamily)
MPAPIPPDTAVSARDAAWVDRIRQGDHAAFAALYEEYLAAMVGFTYRIVQSAASAEDIVADVFVTVWQRRLEWTPRFGARAYLFHAARMRALDTVRNAATAARLSDVAVSGGASLGMAAPPPSILDTLDDEARLAAVDAAIARMPDMRRRIMELRWRHGLAIDEIAVVIGISRAAVDQHLSRGLRDLRHLFGTGQTR